MECDDWVNDIICLITKYIVDIKSTWSEIGYSPNQLTTLQGSLKSNSIKLFRDILSHAECEKVALKDKVDQLRVEVSNIEAELQVPHKHIASQTLLTLLDQLSTYRSELDQKINELTADFKRLKSSEENLCKLLNVPPLDGFPLIPSLNDKLRVQHQVVKLEDLKKERTEKVLHMKKCIQSCIDYLKTDCSLTVSNSMQELMTTGNEIANLSEDYLREIDSIQDQYMDLVDKFRTEENDLFENIGSLRKRLDLPPFVIPNEQSLCPSKRIKYGTEELNRLRELRLANLRHLMKACVIELEEIWTNCFVSTDYQQNFRKSMSLECTEENLSRLEGEVQKWKRFKSSHQCFYDALTVWLDTLQQIKSIEIKRQDPTVLKNRGGILLKLDKEDRKLRNRDLPKQTTNLESIIASECRGEDAGLFSLVCFEGQSLAGQKENSLSHIIDKSLDFPSSGVGSSTSSGRTPATKDGPVYATGKRPPLSRTASPRSNTSVIKKPRVEYHGTSRQ